MDAEKQNVASFAEKVDEIFGGQSLSGPQVIRLKLLAGIAVIAIAGWFAWSQYKKSFSAVEGTSPRSWAFKVHKRSGWYDPGISLPKDGGILKFSTDTRVIVSVGGQEYVINPGQEPLMLNDVDRNADIEFKLSMDAHQEIGRVNMEVF